MTETPFEYDFVLRNLKDHHEWARKCIKIHDGTINSLAVPESTPSIVASSGSDCKVKVVDFTNASHTCKSVVDQVFCLEFSRDSNFLYSGDADGRIVQSRFDSGEIRENSIFTNGTNLPIMSLSSDIFNPNLLHSAGIDGNVDLYDFREKSLIFRMNKDCEMMGIAAHPTAPELFLCAGDSGSIELYDKRNVAEPIRTYSTKLRNEAGSIISPSISSVTWHPVGTVFIASIRGFLPALYSIFKSEPISLYYGDGYGSFLSLKHFSFYGPNDSWIAAGSDNGKLFIWELSSQILNQESAINILSSDIERFGGTQMLDLKGQPASFELFNSPRYELENNMTSPLISVLSNTNSSRLFSSNCEGMLTIYELAL